MGSLNASGISVVAKQKISYRNVGRAVTSTNGLIPNVEGLLIDKPLFARNANELGTQPDKNVTQRSTISYSKTVKVAQSTNDSLVSRDISDLEPTEIDQPEIELKDETNRSYTNTGKKVAIRQSDGDGLVGREG